MHLEANKTLIGTISYFNFRSQASFAISSGMKRSPVTSQYKANQLLDSLLALDRRVVERSLRIYNVPRHERTRMRAQMRQLHQAVRAIHLSPRKIAVRNAWR
jgi:hypothetical protein